MGIEIAAYDGGRSCQVWGGCSPLSRFELLSDRHPDLGRFANSFEVWPLQVDLKQQVGHFLQVLQKTID